MASHPSNARYPDATAITFDKSNFKVTVIYNDHSIYVWDVRDITKVKNNVWGFFGFANKMSKVKCQFFV